MSVYDDIKLPQAYVLGIASFCRVVAMAPAETRLAAFRLVIRDAVKLADKFGLEHALVVDRFHDLAQSTDLIENYGLTEVEAAIAGALIDTNGHDYSAVWEMPGAAQPAASGPVLVPLLYPFPIDEKTIPRRPWIVPGLLLRRHVSVLVAPPGSGKSLLTLQVALMMAQAKPWGGWQTRAAAKTLIINAEDDYDEMRRRLFAGAKTMNCDPELLREWVALADAPENIIIARADGKTRTVTRTPMVENIIATILKGGFDCVIIDPFAETFEGNENANSELKWAAMLWREIARRTNCAVLLVHHTRKFANDPGDMDAARGAGALLGVARVVSTVFNMSEREAKAFEIDTDHRHEYLRFDDAKANLSLVTFKAKWFFKETFRLGNGSDDEPADEVGVLKEWKPPSIFDKLDESMARAVLMAIDFGMVDDEGAPTGDIFTLTKQGGSKRWAGQVLQEHLGGEDKCPAKEAQKALDIWHANGVLTEVERVLSNSKGKPRKGIKVNLAALPGTQTEVSL